jgi:hypothetical protein
MRSRVMNLFWQHFEKLPKIAVFACFLTVFRLWKKKFSRYEHHSEWIILLHVFVFFLTVFQLWTKKFSHYELHTSVAYISDFNEWCKGEPYPSTELVTVFLWKFAIFWNFPNNFSNIYRCTSHITFSFLSAS